MLEALETRAGQHFQFVGQGDLILHECRVGLEVLFVVSRCAGQRRAWLAVDRIEDVDRVGTDRAAGALDDRLVIVIFILDAGEQGVLQTASVEMPGEVELGVLVGPFQLAVVEVAPQRAAVSGNAVGLDRVALERAVEPLETTAQGPVVVEHVLETQLRHVVVVVQLADVLLAKEGIARGSADLRRVARHATIERRVVAHEIAFENQLGRVGGLPGQHRRDAVALGLDMIAEGVTALAHHIQAIGQTPFFIQRPGSVEGAALHALVVQLAA